jgi:hypothetical protein
MLGQYEHVPEVAGASISAAVILARSDSAAVLAEDSAGSTRETDICANRIRRMIFPFAREGVCVKKEQLRSGLGRVYHRHEEPIDPILYPERRIDRYYAFEKHPFMRPTIGKRVGSIQFHGFIGARFWEHVYFALVLEDKRIRKMVARREDRSGV